MAFVSTRNTKTVVGNQRMSMGTFSSASADTQGVLETGLHQSVKTIQFQLDSDSASNAKIQPEALPAGGPDIDVAVVGTCKGTWIAFGR